MQEKESFEFRFNHERNETHLLKLFFRQILYFNLIRSCKRDFEEGIHEI